MSKVFESLTPAQQDDLQRTLAGYKDCSVCRQTAIDKVSPCQECRKEYEDREMVRNYVPYVREWSGCEKGGVNMDILQMEVFYSQQ